MYSYSGHEDDDDSVRFEKPSRHGDADDDDLGVELDSPDTSSRRSHQGSSSTNSSIRFENSPDQEYSAQVSIIYRKSPRIGRTFLLPILATSPHCLSLP